MKHVRPDSVWLHLSAIDVQYLFHLAEAELMLQGSRRVVLFQCESGLPPVVVDQARIITVLGYLVQCADRSAGPGISLRVRASVSGARPRVTVGSAGVRLRGIAETQSADFQPAAPGESPTDWLDEELMLSVCVNLLAAQGVQLHMDPTRLSEEMFWFELPMQD